MSNLTVTYTTQIAPGTAPAAGVAAAVGAPAADNPLGFLAALIDQLLAGGAEAIETQAGLEADTGTSLTQPGLLSFALDTKTETKVVAAPEGADLLAALTKQLNALQTQLSSGESPAPGQLAKLDDAIAALSAAIDAPLAVPVVDPDTALDPIEALAPVPQVQASLSDDQIAQLLVDLGLIEPPAEKPANTPVVATRIDPAVEITGLRDQLLALSKAVAATAPDLSQKLEALATKLASVDVSTQLAAQLPTSAAPADPDATTIAHIIRTLLGETNGPSHQPKSDANVNAAVTANTHADELLQVLAQLGLSTTAPTSNAAPDAQPVAASATVTATVPTPLLRLSDQLGKVSTALADTHPDLARKLETFAGRIVSSDVDANILGQITSAAKSGGDASALDHLVQSLIEGRPVQAPPAPPAPAPQIASAASLAIPAPIAPKATKPAVTEVKAAQPEPASVAAGSAPDAQPRVALTAAREPVARLDPEPKPDPKAASVIAEAVKSEASQSSSAPAQPAPAAPAAQHARAIPAAYQAAANPINMGQVAFEMVRQVQHGTSRFTIRLDPPELGRVDVKMHVDTSGAVNARLTVDRPETLDLFQRDRQSLERALSQAGLDTSKTNLEFSLRQNHQNPFSGMMGGDPHHGHPDASTASRFSLDESDDIVALPAVTLYRGLASAGGVNIVA